MAIEVSSQGPFIQDAAVAGEQRADGAYPHMADVMQLSHNRWLVLYGTRGWLGVDDGFNGNDNDRSILYQLRADGPTGPVLKEGLLAKYAEDWDLFGDGEKFLRQYCHTGGFGVPKGALVRGQRVPHENVFVASWYVCPRLRGTNIDTLPAEDREEEVFEQRFGVEWLQFRLRADGNDIEILQKPQPLRQKGYETGEAYCNIAPRTTMNKWYVRPQPYNDDMSQWVQAPHFGRGIAVIRWQFNAQTGLYEWVETGPLFDIGKQAGLWNVDGGKYRLTETSIIRHGDSWFIAARSAEPGSKNVPGTAWMRTDDLFRPLPQPVFPGAPLTSAPTAVVRCADGVVRIFTGDSSVSPYKNQRDPLYCWDVDLDNGFKISNRHVVFDTIKAQLAVRPDTGARIDMPNLIPHAGGDTQLLTFRVRLRRSKAPFTRITDEEKRRSALYLGQIRYDQGYAAHWSFAESKATPIPAAAARSKA